MFTYLCIIRKQMSSYVSSVQSLNHTSSKKSRIMRSKIQIRLPNYFYSRRTGSFYFSQRENYILLSEILMKNVIFIEFRYESKTMKFPVQYEIRQWEDIRGVKCILDMLPENQCYLQNREYYLIGKCIELHLTGIYGISEYNLDELYGISRTFNKKDMERMDIIYNEEIETEYDSETELEENIRNDETESLE